MDSEIHNKRDFKRTFPRKSEAGTSFIENGMIEPPIISYKGKTYSNSDICVETNESVSLVLCLDGTENEFGLMPYTNVLKLFKMLDKDSPDQLCYYQPGIGVRFQAESNDIREGNFLTSKLSKITSKSDAMFAFTLERHVIAAYNFLMKFYRRGDKIYMFGFRGSFTGRVLAGMIERVGLLNNGLEEMTTIAWELYSNWEYAGQPAHNDSTLSLVAEFKETFSRKGVEIHFMGLWDSVNSVGIIRDRLFPYTIRSSIVDHVRHAVSIDERRSKYKQVLFQPYSYYPLLFNLGCQESDIGDEEETEDRSSSSFNTITSMFQNFEPGDSYPSITSLLAHMFPKRRKKRLTSLPSEDIIELFFPGNHGDCGGGWSVDLKNQSLSDIPLRWILSQAIKFGVRFKSGIIHDFDEKHPVNASFLCCNHDVLSLKKSHVQKYRAMGPSQRLKKTWERISYKSKNYQEMISQIEISPRSAATHQNSTTQISSSVKEVFKLPKSPIKGFDARGDESIWTTLAWWIIELLPLGYKIENKKGEWKRVYYPNLGRPRKIPRNSMFHWSFFYRLHYIEDYYPKNVPRDLGSSFQQSLSEFKNLFDEDKIDNYAQSLTIGRIKIDWESDIWTKIPDELQQYLELYPDL